MGRILSAFLMLGISSMCGAQIYKYLGIEDGLSNRRIYRIQKDGRGYMWFLTQEGMDRYDGKRIRHYTVLDGNLKVAPQVNLNWLYTDTENTLWVVGRKGRIFHYDTLHDRFRMVYRIPGLQDDFATGMLCYAYMDRGDRIWLCQGDHIIRYDTRTGIAQRLVSRLRGDITAISETDGTNLFIGTVNGLFPVRERDGVLEALADTDSIRTPVSELYYHPGSKKLFVGTFRKGILVYGVSAGSTLRNVAVNRITPLNDRELLIATGGRGVYRMDMDSLVPKPYITADYASHNGMKSVIYQLGFDDFPRIRVGVGAPEGGRDLIAHVMSMPTGEALDKVKAALNDAADAAELMVSGRIADAQMRFNKKPKRKKKEEAKKAEAENAEQKGETKDE